jgi:hypothetical protein
MPDKILPQVYAAWKKQNTIPPMNQNLGQQTGAVGQSLTGIQNGGGGQQGMVPFGSQQAKGLPMSMQSPVRASIGQ